MIMSSSNLKTFSLFPGRISSASSKYAHELKKKKKKLLKFVFSIYSFFKKSIIFWALKPNEAGLFGSILISSKVSNASFFLSFFK